MRYELIGEQRTDDGALEIETLWTRDDQSELTRVHHILSPSRSATRGQRIIRNAQGAMLHASGEWLPPDIAPDDLRLWRYIADGSDASTWVRIGGEQFGAFGFVPTSGERPDPEFFDPQWQREEFVRDPADEISKIAEWKALALDAQLTRGEPIRKRQRTTVNLQVGAGLDDGFRETGTDLFQDTQTFTSFGTGSGAAVRKEWARFTSVAIANAATIDLANFVYTGLFGETTAVEFKSRANDIDDAVAPTSNAEYDALTLTTAGVDWDFSTTWTDNSEFTSVDIKTVIQEVVDRGSWASGNALMTMMQNDQGAANRRRSPHSYENDTAAAPKLNVDFTAVAGVAQSIFRSGIFHSPIISGGIH
jgi:hypothetical protein